MGFSKNIIALNFYINRNAIAEKYCINKYKPGLHCNGHCFLVKQLKKEQQQETKDFGDQFSKIEAVSAQNHFPQLQPEYYTVVLENKFPNNYHFYHTKDITLLVFKPPRMA